MEPTVSQIIQPALDCASFTVDGITYTRTDTLALSRGRILQRFQTEMLFDTTLPGLIQSVAEADKEFNSGKLADGFYKFGHLKQKINLLGTNTVRVAEIVGLFYNAPDEDPTTYQHGQQQQKVYEAWRALDMDFFKVQAWSLLQRTSTHYPPLPAAVSLEPKIGAP